MRASAPRPCDPLAASQAARLAAALLAGCGFVAVLLLGKRLADDVDFLGLSDDTIHMLGHIGVYGGLGILLYKAFGRRPRLAWVAANLLAAGEEYRQAFVPGRTAALDDAIVNVLSITTAIALMCVWQRLRRRYACQAKVGDANTSAT